MTCECQVCKDIARWKHVIINGDETQRLNVLTEMFSRIEEAETDVDYYRAILRGQWPNGKTILEHALKKYDSAKS